MNDLKKNERGMAARKTKGFPSKVSSKGPSTSAGFRLQSLKSLSLPSFSAPTNRDDVCETPTTFMLLDPPKSANENFDSSVVSGFNASCFDKELLMDKVKLGAEYFQDQEEKVFLRSSFSNDAEEWLRIFAPNKRIGVVQTEEPILYRKEEFESMQLFRDWAANEVDTFMKKLRKSIIANKPQNVEAFVVAYCRACASRSPEPTTKILPNIFGANRPKTNKFKYGNSLIRLSAMTEVPKNVEQQLREMLEKAGADADADADAATEAAEDADGMTTKEMIEQSIEKIATIIVEGEDAQLLP